MVINDKAFSFPFKDRQWAGKFLVGSLLLLATYVIPVVPLIFVLGYVVRGMHFTIRSGENRLPEWDDWTDLGVKGILSMLIYFIYSLPGLVLIAGAGVAFGLYSLLIGLGGDGSAWSMVMPLTVTSRLLLLAAIVIAAAGTVLLIVGILMSPAAIARFAASGDLSAALHVGRIWAIIRSRLGSFALVWAITYGLSYIAGSIYGLLFYTVCCCCLVPLLSAPIAFYTLIVGMTLFAQIYREGESVTSGAPLLLPDKTDSARAAEVVGTGESDGAGTTSPTTAAEVATTAPAEPSGPAQPTAAASGQGTADATSADALTLSTLELSARTARVLQENGFITVGQIVRALERGDKELLSIKGFGAKSLEELKTRLEAQGIGTQD